MRAIAMMDYGDVDVLKEINLPKPSPGKGEVLVRVKAVALNHLDLWTRRGMVGHTHEFPHILGSDIAGVVEEVGEGVSDLKPGDEVVLAPAKSCGVCEMCTLGEDNLCPHYSILGEHVDGGYVEYLAIERKYVFRKVEGLSFVEAAAIPLAALTAYNALIRKGNLQPTETILIMSAGGGVGSLAVQIAKNVVGARVITTVGSDWKVEKALHLGADRVINWRKEDILEVIKKEFGRVDMVLDHTGSMHIEKLIRVTRWGGRIVMYGATSGYDARVDLRHIFYRQVSLIGSTMGRRGDLFRIWRLVDMGKIKPVVDSVFPFTEEGVREAHRKLESGQVFGKVVISME